jgi:hypothetical protein
MATSALVDDMGVHNVGFLIENLGADASELQYLRELVQNAFESIQRRGGNQEGRVEIDFEEVKGVRKLRISDNGGGMTPDEVRANINHLSASGGVQAFDKNFGIGAKITAGTRNPHGVIFKAWKNGEGSLTVMGRVDGRYGRIGFRNPIDETVDYWLPLGDDDKPTTIQDNGVSVVLLGRSDEDDTTIAPPGVDLPSQWVAAYLERRYFKIPNGITLKVKRPVEIYDSVQDKKRAIFDTIQGQKYYLDKHSEAKDVCDLPDVNATVYWWLLSDAIVKGGKTWNNRGHVAAIYQGELYEVHGGQARISALKDFGIYAGHGRVVIYVEPSNVLKANTARTSLILSGNRSIDYAEIGASFAEEMPVELAAYMAGQVSSEKGDHRNAIRKNLKEVEEALKVARFRRSKSGVLGSFDDDFGGVASVDIGAGSGSSRRRNGTGQKDDGSGRIGGDYLRRAQEEREKRLRAETAHTDPMPRIVWDVSGNTVPVGRAATYTKATHVVTASALFSFFQDMVEWAFEEVKKRTLSEIDDDTIRSICDDEVRRWFEQALTEAVVVLRPMARDEKWGPKVFETGLSDEGLTAAVISHRWHMMSAIKRGLAGRLGRAREAVVPNNPK